MSNMYNFRHNRAFQALSPSHGYTVPAPSQRGLNRAFYDGLSGS